MAAFGFVLLLALSCSAPHDNPLDPESDSYVFVPTPKHSLTEFSALARSLHISRNFPTTQTYSVVIEAWTVEAIELDSVWVTYRDRAPIAMDRVEFGVWGSVLQASYFETEYGVEDPTMVGVLGQPFVVRFAVTGDTIYTLEPVYMIRAIEATPVLLAPMSHDTVSPRPTLSWQAFDAPFDYRYRVSVWKDEVDFDAETWFSDTLSSDVTELQAADSLADGNYYWLLYAIDEFLNYSRSKEGTFVVRAEANP